MHFLALAELAPLVATQNESLVPNNYKYLVQGCFVILHFRREAISRVRAQFLSLWRVHTTVCMTVQSVFTRIVWAE